MNSENENNEHFPCAELKSEQGYQIKMASRGYQYGNQTRGWDADWLIFNLTIKVPGFLGQLVCIYIGAKEIERLINHLDKFNKLKLKTVTFEPMEPCIVLEMTCGRRYEVLVKGNAHYPLGTGSILSFEFETDLSFVEIFIRGLKKINAEFPSRL